MLTSPRVVFLIALIIAIPIVRSLNLSYDGYGTSHHRAAPEW